MPLVSYLVILNDTYLYESKTYLLILEIYFINIAVIIVIT